MRCPTIFLAIFLCLIATGVYSQDSTAAKILPASGFPEAPILTAAEQTDPDKILYGIASWYSDKFHGRKTASGEIFDQTKMTCANNKLPFGTWLKVTNLRNKRWVYVKVNDRLHYKNTRIVDLSRAAASKLGILNTGIVKVKVEVLGKKKPTE